MKFIGLWISLKLFHAIMCSRNAVYIYNGYGNSKQSYQMLYNHTAKLLQNTKWSVKDITPAQIKHGDWSRRAALLAIGGGFDVGFIKAFGDDGLRKIRQYVEEGGRYLGICAGAYLGCSSIEFDKGGPLEVCGNRPLGFYKGTCIGSLYPGFKYNSETGAHAVRISMPEQSHTNLHSQSASSIQTSTDQSASFIHRELSQSYSQASVQIDQSNSTTYCYFNGGGYFKPGPLNTCEVLSWYLDPPNVPPATNARPLPAIVKCAFGRGVAVLSGVHFEYLVEGLNLDDPNLSTVIPRLKEAVPGRRKLLIDVLRHCRLDIDGLGDDIKANL